MASGPRQDPRSSPAGTGPDDPWREEREAMVRHQIALRGVRDPRVLAAMAQVPRHRFVPADLREQAYDDWPLPIGGGQTISQPYIVAAMAEALELTGGERVLEVGSGCGYMMAVLSRLAAWVGGMDLEARLFRLAEANLADLGCANVEVRCGDGAQGWPERAPFDAIVVSCAAPALPPRLWEQLAAGGRMVVPVGPPGYGQDLVLARRTAAGRELTSLMGVAFVPLREPGD
jgi:protein-L-isoaspartate(D-aspartate) O-methyltransferase